MANKPDIDIATLVQPISDLLPSGESLRRGSVYDRIKEARREDDPNLAQGIWKTEVKRADWNDVAKTALEALQSKSKDLRIAAWLSEAWLKIHGPTGCERGFRIIEGLLDRFWDTVYPQIDEDGDLDSRMAPLGWINEKLSVTLKGIAMTRPNTKEPDILTWQNWERASMMERAGQKAGEDEVSTARFMTAVLLTPASYYRQLSSELHDLKQAAEDIERLVDKKAGEPMATLWQFKETLDAIADFIGKALDQKAEEEPGGDEEGEEAGESGGGSRDIQHDPGGRGVRWGPIRNRAEAYQRLAEAADYLIQKEPHSPVPHLIRRAVSWGNMTFAELVQELVNDQHNLNSIYGLLGMKGPE